MAKDYYEALGVSKDATKADIKKAYLRLAKQYHPDLNKDANASEKFKEINEAASILGDDKKRAQYDRFGATSQGFGGGAGGFDFNDFGNYGFDFGDIFDRFFSQGFGRSRRQAKGNDLHYDMEIDLEEAATGVKKVIHIPRLEKCNKCSGKGAEHESDIKKCDNCGGRGVVEQSQRVAFGLFTTQARCGKCRGSGQYVSNPCSMCDGEGRIEKSRKLDVDIPPGIDNGMSLRMSGQGEAGEKGATPGDLFVSVHVRAHKLFEREGDDLNVEVPIGFSEASLGGEVEVPTLTGKATLKIPSGTQSGTVFSMRGKGVPNVNSRGVGDENVRVVVQVPKTLSKRQKEILKEFAKEEKKSFLKKMF